MAKKASRVHYSGIGTFIDDTQANRIQAFGSSSRLTTEDMRELGTLNIVEIVDDVPQVDISIDQNENGTNDLLALLSNRSYGCNVVAVPSGSQIGSASIKVLPGSYIINGERVFFEGTVLSVPTSGNQKVFLKPEVSGNAIAKVAVATSVTAGCIEIANFTGKPVLTQADIVDARPFKTVKERDFELANVDIFVPVKQAGDGDVIKRSMYMEKAYINNLDLSFQTSGVATASYRLETDNKRWFLNDNAQIIVDQIKASAGTTVGLTRTPSPLVNGNKILHLSVNGTPKTEGTDFTVAGTTVTFSSALTAGSLVKARYCSNTGGAFFVPVPVAENPHPELAGGIRQGQIEIFLTDSTSRLVRVQSVRISLPLTREALAELGSIKPYDRPMTLPVNTSITLEFRDSDLEMLARFAGYANIDTVDEIALEDLVKNMGLIVKIYRESDVKRQKLPAGHPDKFAIKTITLNNLIPQSESWDVRIDSDATQTFEFMNHNVTISDEIVPN